MVSKTVLVTGGAGFIGSNYIEWLNKNRPDYRVICLDKLTYAGNQNNLKSVMANENFRFVKGDICDQKLVFELFASEQPDIVINFAAETHVDRSIIDPHVFLKTNVIGTQILMDACLKYKTARYHQVSTDEVYGDLPLDRPELCFAEDAPLCPSSPYAASKASADLLVLAYCRTYNLPATISRCTNNYGPYQHPEKLIPRMITMALSDLPLPVYGTGKNIRNWLHVTDHCIAIDLIVHNGRLGEIYNVGGQTEMTNLDVVNMIRQEIMGTKSPIMLVADRKGHDLRYAVDITKIQHELGWYAHTRFCVGIKETIQWYIQNIDRFDPR